MADIAGGPKSEITVGFNDQISQPVDKAAASVQRSMNQIAKSLGISDAAWDKMGKAAQAAAVKTQGAVDAALAKTMQYEAELKKIEGRQRLNQSETALSSSKTQGRINLEAAHNAGQISKLSVSSAGKLALSEAAGENQRLRYLYQQTTNFQNTQNKMRLMDYRKTLRRQADEDDQNAAHYKKVLQARAAADKTAASVRGKAVQDELSLFNSIIKRSRGGTPEFEAAVKGAISGFGPAFARRQAVAGGATLEEAFQENLREAVGGLASRSLTLAGAKKTPSMVAGSSSGGGGGKGISGLLRRVLGGGGGGVAGSLVGGLLGGIGVGVGGYALANLGQGLLDATKQATAYDRQAVAAKNLAGSQAQLNELLAVYQKESGGAISKTDSLAAVTRLLATGYAKNTKDLGQFVRASRGSSIALGRPQEDVTQDIQLAISNTSVKRLDQIGLGIKEVNDRITLLRKNDKGLQREQAFGAAVMQLLDEKYGKLSKTAEGQATGLEKLAKAWDDLTLAMGKNAKSPVNRLAGGVANTIGYYSSPDRNEASAMGLGNLTPKLLNKDNPFDQLSAFLAGFGTKGQVTRYNLSQLAQGGGNGLTRYGDGAPTASRPPVSRWDSMRDDQQQVLTDAYKQSLEIEKNYNRQRQDEVSSYNQSVASLEKNYHKSQIREDEDFARSRARATRDYDKQIVNVIRDSQERDANYLHDYNKNVSLAKRDGNKRLSEIEDNYQEEQKKALKSHRLAMLKAAGQLDAVALLDERLAYKLDQDERKKAHDKQVKDEQDALAQRLSDLKDNYDEQLSDAHKADKKRIEEMAADRKQQLADEDEDRAIQKGREIQDHNDELDEMTRVHNEKMAKITEEYNDQVKAFQDALGDSLAAVGIYLDGYQEKLDKRNQKILEFYDKIADKIEAAIKMEKEGNVAGRTVNSLGGSIPQFASGGYVPSTGVALLHAGEYVMPSSLVNAVGNSHVNYGGSSHRSVQVHPGAFQVYTTPGMETMVGKQIEEILLQILEAA